MNDGLTVIMQKEGNWFVAFCPEVPGANGQGHSKEECLNSLKEAIKLIFKDRREEAFNRLKDSSFTKERIVLAWKEMI